jgi:hypothetical protein
VRRAAKVDDNHGEIVKALRSYGCSVLDLSAVGKGCPDLLVTPPNSHSAFLMEIKDGKKPPSARKLTDAQVKFHSEWTGWISVVTSVDEALLAVGVFREQN